MIEPNSPTVPLDRIREWVFEQALPFWAENGADWKYGGFLESLNMRGADAGVDFKRTRVTARQIYVFSHAHLLGWSDGAALAEHGIRHLIEKAWLPDQRCFARRVARNGDVIDFTPDLYDHAFALYAFGWYLRATGDKAALVWAHHTLDAIERSLAHRSGEGFCHQIPLVGPRQQNPHMHLAEAALAVFEASNEERFAQLAADMVSLFERRFYDSATNTLAEFFSDDWSRDVPGLAQSVEPGHQFEWAWILQNGRRLLGIDCSDAIRGLVHFAELYGVDSQTGVTFNQVSEHGSPIDRGSRTWPNTERMKSAVAIWDLDRVDPRPVLGVTSNVLFDRFLATPVPGLWVDAFDASGQQISTTVPASTLYHVMLAFTEALRVMRSLEGV